MALPKGHISYNQIRQYQTCPQKYKYSYIDKIKTAVNDKIYLGIIYHLAVEFFLRAKVNGDFLSHEELLDFFNDNFKKKENDIEVFWKEDQSKSNTISRGIAFLTYFYNHYAKIIDPFLIEEEMETKLEKLGINLKGIPDLIEKDFSITDFKTTTAKWSKQKINQSLLQMIIYKYLFENHFGKVNKELKFRIIYSKNSTNIKHQEMVLNSTDISFEKMFDIIGYVVDQISNGRFYKNEGFFCRFCEFKPICSS
jgi:predicted RecB family nuclease